MPLGSPIYQKYVELPKAQGRTILTSSWVVNGMPAGLCFREDTSRLTNNNSGSTLQGMQSPCFLLQAATHGRTAH